MNKNAIKILLDAGAVILLGNAFAFAAAVVPAGHEDSARTSSGMSASKWYDEVHEMTLLDGTKLAGTITAQTSRLITILTSDSATIGIPIVLISTFDGRPYSADSANAIWKGNGALLTGKGKESSGAPPWRTGSAQNNSEIAGNRNYGIGGVASINDLLGALRSLDWEKRSAAARELGMRGQWKGGAIEAVSALLGDTIMESSLLQVPQADSSAQAKLLSPGLEAAKALAAMQERGFDELAHQMNNVNPLVRQRAAFGLGETHNNQCVPILLKTLKDRDPQVRAAAAGALHFAEATPQLIKAVDDNDEKVRAGAVTALGQIGDAASENALVAALGDVNPSVRSAAAGALGRIGSRTAIYPLTTVIADPERNVRLSAVIALSKIRDSATVPALIASLKDHDGAVVKTAAIALGDMRDPRAISPLRSALQTCPESARGTVGLSLKLLTEIPLLIGALDDRDTLVRRNAEYLLWLITGKKLGYDKKAWADWFVSRGDSGETKTPQAKFGDTAAAPEPK